MTSLLKIGLILVAVTIVLVLVHPAEADDDVKRKRVIIKIPHRVKHIYHHHTKKIHIKKKPKPKPKKKKPHKHVHVVVEEEEIVQPIKSWKTVQSSFKGNSGWEDWKPSPSGFKHSVNLPDEYGGAESHMEEDFSIEEDHEPRESRTYGRGSSYKVAPASSKGRRGKKKGGTSNSSYRTYEDPLYDASYETYQDPERERPRRKPKTTSTGSKPKGRGYSSRPSSRKPKSRPQFEEKLHEQDEYDELYDRGPVWPERKEHPSWRERAKKEAGTSGSNAWRLPKVPDVNEFIDDVNDTPDPGATYINSGGFYPSAYNPITTITSSVVQKSPTPQKAGGQVFIPKQPLILPAPVVVQPLTQYSLPKTPLNQNNAGSNKIKHKQNKNPGYLSQVSQTSEGMTVGYQAHIGHSSDVRNPSSSFQSVSYAGVKGKK